MENKKNTAKLEIIIGPMFSGKTTELIRRVKRYKIVGLKCIVFKYSKDDRYSKDKIATHDKIDDMECVSVSDLLEIPGCDVIAVDEAQFFKNVIPFTIKALLSNKIVVLAGLDSTWELKPFDWIKEVICLAEKVDKLSAVCMSCKNNEASFTKRISKEKELEVIGGSDKYMAVCRRCLTMS